MAAALAGGKMLDLYSYVGQWGMAAARAGAEQVVCVDRSQLAIDLVEKNAQINGFGELITGECSSVDEFLRSVPDRSYDAVVCDPPSFIRNKKHVSAGLRAYRTLFAHALRKVRTGGFAVLASCSHHLFEDRFSRVVEEAARWGDVRLSVVMRGEQSPCHPVPQAFPEARYLKCWLVQVQRLVSTDFCSLEAAADSVAPCSVRRAQAGLSLPQHEQIWISLVLKFEIFRCGLKPAPHRLCSMQRRWPGWMLAKKTLKAPIA